MEPINTVAYYLVLLCPAANHAEASEYYAAHVSFVEEMEAANIVLLGGDFDEMIHGADAAYLLHTASRAVAEEWAARDPLVRSGAYTAHIVVWHLVGISPDAIDSRLV